MIRRGLVALALVAASLAVTPAGPASAVGFTVNSNGDSLDALPGDGICATAAKVCTLRAAVQEANSLPGSDVITVPGMTIGLNSALILSSNVTLQGAGARSTILQATNGAHGMLIVNAGIVAIRGFSVTGATGGGALGLAHTGGDLTIDGVRFTGNNASVAGGAYGPVYSSGGTLKLLNSEISGNTTTSTSTSGWGGGLSVYSATVTVVNTTIAGNSVSGASSAAGGGVWAGMNSNITITSSTIAGNSVASSSRVGAAIYQSPGGSGSVEVKDSILAEPQGATNCSLGGRMPVFLGRNLVDDTGCGGASPTRTIAAAGLGPLSNNGGESNTRVPSMVSPAINAASACATAGDQRGQARPVAGACDLGAAEVSSEREMTLAVSNPTPVGGSDIVVTATARNNGLDLSTGTTVVVQAVGAAPILSAKVLGGECPVSGDTATCSLGAVPAGSAPQVLLQVRMPASGSLVVTATVAGDQPDPVAANNSASASATVPASGGVPTQGGGATPDSGPTSGVCTAVRNGTNKANTLRGTAASDLINGKGGNDRIDGRGGIDCLNGGKGKDRITGGPGPDRVEAGAGNDLIFAKDGTKDRVNCGPGRDRVIADKKDTLSKCEVVRRA